MPTQTKASTPKLLERLQTTSDAARILQYIGELKNNLYETKSRFEASMDTILPSDIREEFKEVFKSENVNTDDPGRMQAYLDELLERIKKIPSVDITLAFYPKKIQLDKLLIWFQKNYTQTVLLNIQVDESLIGGIQVAFNGVFKDYSLKKQLSQL